MHISRQELCMSLVQLENVGIFGKSFHFQINFHLEGVVRSASKRSLFLSFVSISFPKTVPWENRRPVNLGPGEAPFPEALMGEERGLGMQGTWGFVSPLHINQGLNCSVNIVWLDRHQYRESVGGGIALFNGKYSKPQSNMTDIVSQGITPGWIKTGKRNDSVSHTCCCIRAVPEIVRGAAFCSDPSTPGQTSPRTNVSLWWSESV